MMCTKCKNGKYYITTAITYTSGKPHIGNTYEIVLADSIARFKRQQGYDMFIFRLGQTSMDKKFKKKQIRQGSRRRNMWIRWQVRSKKSGIW